MKWCFLYISWILISIDSEFSSNSLIASTFSYLIEHQHRLKVSMSSELSVRDLDYHNQYNLHNFDMYHMIHIHHMFYNHSILHIHYNHHILHNIAYKAIALTKLSYKSILNEFKF